MSDSVNHAFISDHATAETLSAFHDDQLDSATAASVRAHLDRCAACALELQRLIAMSGWFTGMRRPALTPIGRARVHQRIDAILAAQLDSALIRFGWRISGIAASILLAGSICLMVGGQFASPSGQAPVQSGVQSGVQPVQMVDAAPPWVGVAVTSDADAVVRNASTPAAAIYLADASSDEPN